MIRSGGLEAGSGRTAVAGGWEGLLAGLCGPGYCVFTRLAGGGNVNPGQVHRTVRDELDLAFELPDEVGVVFVSLFFGYQALNPDLTDRIERLPAEVEFMN